jgi:lipopolysaccharide/colanic/teichoic acid biosynthesis glycosyltransferase
VIESLSPAVSQVRAFPQTAEETAAEIRIWGLSVRELHDAYWRGRGVQCIRAGVHVPVERAADLYLLLDPDQLVLFDLGEILERVAWRRAHLTRLQLEIPERNFYAEHIVLDADGYVQRIQRSYDAPFRSSRRMGLSLSAKIARRWMDATPDRDGWRAFRRAVPLEHFDRLRVSGRIYDADDPRQQRKLLLELISRWQRPDQSIDGVHEVADGVWAPRDLVIGDDTALIGPLWIGFVPSLPDHACRVGPDLEVDDAAVTEHAPVTLRDMIEIESQESRPHIGEQSWRGIYPVAKRTMDIVASAVTLLVLSPVFLIIALLIWKHDGRPIFYRHLRQTRGGREFGCLKFRTMMNNAEQMVAQLQSINQCDGPQVFIQNDPRVTPIGRVLRKVQLDEIPQFWNVLKGDMSLVGPRPSPDRENQYCPAWRELRLSVRPGITGLWQLNRTRAPGEDFQEWIRYDIEYVREASFWLDISICVRTLRMVLFGRREHAGK